MQELVCWLEVFAAELVVGKPIEFFGEASTIFDAEVGVGSQAFGGVAVRVSVHGALDGEWKFGHLEVVSGRWRCAQTGWRMGYLSGPSGGRWWWLAEI